MMLFWLYPLTLVLVPLVLAAAWYRSSQPAKAVLVPATHLFPRGNARRISWTMIAYMSASTLAVTAAASPMMKWAAQIPVPAVLMVVLDNSASMAENDVAGPGGAGMTRWEVATQALMEVLESKERDPNWTVGLVLCAGQAELVCPPVNRLATLASMIRDSGPRQNAGLAGTDLASGLVLALETAMASNSTVRAVLVISDGENNASPPESGKTVQQMGQIAKTLGVPCHSIEVSGGRNPSGKPSGAHQLMVALGEITGGVAVQSGNFTGAQQQFEGVLGIIESKRRLSDDIEGWSLGPALALMSAWMLGVAAWGLGSSREPRA